MLHLTEKANLPMEPVPGVSVIEIAGDGRVLIENHKGIVGYESNMITVRVSYGHVQVMGDRLELSNMSARQILIRGKIQGITLLKGV